jgi:hypothetical protein
VIFGNNIVTPPEQADQAAGILYEGILREEHFGFPADILTPDTKLSRAGFENLMGPSMPQLRSGQQRANSVGHLDPNTIRKALAATLLGEDEQLQEETPSRCARSHSLSLGLSMPQLRSGQRANSLGRMESTTIRRALAATLSGDDELLQEEISFAVQDPIPFPSYRKYDSFPNRQQYEHD